MKKAELSKVKHVRRGNCTNNQAVQGVPTSLGYAKCNVLKLRKGCEQSELRVQNIDPIKGDEFEFDAIKRGKFFIIDPINRGEFWILTQ